MPSTLYRLCFAVLTVLFTLMPAAIMANQELPSILFYAALLTAVLALVLGSHVPYRAIFARYRGLLLCLAAPTVAVLWSSAWHGTLAGPELERALRFWLGIWVFLLVLPQLGPRQRACIMWGFALAAAIAGSYVFYLWQLYGDRPNTNAVYNAVGYGNLTLLLAVLLILALPALRARQALWQTILIASLAGLSLAAFVLTQTRSGWLAVPFFVFIGVVLYSSDAPQWVANAASGVNNQAQNGHRLTPPAGGSRNTKRIAAGVLIILLTVAAVFAGNPTLRERAQLAYTEALECHGDHSTADTSVCIRLQLWRASLDMLRQHPWAGIGGKRDFAPQLRDDALPRGLVSPKVADGWGEPHNDLLLAFATLGWPGGLALLLVYLAPAWVFWQRLRGGLSKAQQSAAAMGLAVCLGFLIFGLTETMFRGMRTIAYYTMLVGLFLAWSDPLDPLRAFKPRAARLLPVKN